MIDENIDQRIVVEMMQDAIEYKDHQMKAKLIYKKYNDSKKEAH